MCFSKKRDIIHSSLFTINYSLRCVNIAHLCTAIVQHILKTIVSEFMLFSMEGTAKEYAAYGISAVIAAIVFGLFWKSLAGKKSDRTDTGSNLPKSAFQFLSGSIATLIMVQLAVVLVPRFYSFEWRFYKINLLADGIAFFILTMIAAIIRRTAGTAHDDTKAIEGGVSEDGA